VKHRERLEGAGLIRKGHQFSSEDEKLLESLSEHEVEALISAKRKLGDDFLKKHTGGSEPAVGIVF
jgi:hypothetical protein